MLLNFRRLDSDGAWMRLCVLLLGLWLLVTLALPLGTLLIKSFEDVDGAWVGLDNYARYVETPALIKPYLLPGKVTVRKVRRGEAPNTLAAS